MAVAVLRPPHSPLPRRDLRPQRAQTPHHARQRLGRRGDQGFLESGSWEAASAHYTWGNPGLFTGEAVLGVLSLLLRPFAPLADRLERAAARMAAIPRLLEDGRSVLHDAPRA